MATVYDIIGTINNQFTIGDGGITIHYGKYEPNEHIGKIGDIYIQTKYEILSDIDDEVIGENDVAKIYYKNVINGIATWSFIKTYTFDNPIIFDEEIEVGSSNYKISIKKADNNTINKSSTNVNDFEINHNAYGVVRFADNDEVLIDSVAELGSTTNKQIVMTPKQISDNINVEVTRATTVEGKLAELNQGLTNTNLVSAINSENTQRKSEDSKLQEQIDAIVSRSDVVDVVATKTELNSYNTSNLTDRDVIKVLVDESMDDATTYYRWVATTQTTIGNGKFEYVGTEGSYYTKAEADNRFVNIDNEETITGKKTFTQTIISSNDGEILGVQNESGESISAIIGSSSDASNYISLSVANNDGVEAASVDVVYDKATNKSFVTVPLGESTNNVLSTIAASQGWANDPTLSTNIVHRTSNEEINGIKTFNSSPIVPTVSDIRDSSKKAASTEFVQNVANTKQDTIVITDDDVNKIMSATKDGYVWRTIGLHEINTVNIPDNQNTKPEDGQVLIYNASENKWVNGLQKTATIKYW